MNILSRHGRKKLEYSMMLRDKTRCRWWSERRWCSNVTSSSSPQGTESAAVDGFGSLHLGDLGGLFIALAVTLAATTAVSVAQWFWCRRAVSAERRNKPSTGNRLPLSQLRQTVMRWWLRLRFECDTTAV